MDISIYGLRLLAKHDGLSLKAYKCPAGVWTIGYGNTYYEDGTKVKEGDLVTRQRAEELLRVIANDFAKNVDALVKPKLTMQQFDALVSFAYNVGIANFAKSTLLKKVNANPLDSTIRAEFEKWNKANGRVLKGLVTRRKEEADLYFTK